MSLKRSKQDNEAVFLKIHQVPYFFESTLYFLTKATDDPRLTGNLKFIPEVLLSCPGCALDSLFSIFSIFSLERNVTKLSGTFRERLPKGNEEILIFSQTFRCRLPLTKEMIAGGAAGFCQVGHVYKQKYALKQSCI